MNTLLNKETVDQSWFDAFFGVKGGKVHVYVCPTSGSNNYGMSITRRKHEKEACIFISVEAMDDKPYFPLSQTSWLLLHEMGHPYCNPVIDLHAAELAPSGDIIYPHISSIMQTQAYSNWDIVVYESLVRATTLCYLSKNPANKQWLQQILQNEMVSGFFWMPELITLLKLQYESNRKEYPDMNSFMPQIVDFYNKLASKMTGSANPFPKVTASSIVNQSRVPHTTRELTFTFSKPMNPKGYGFNTGRGGAETFPKTEKVEWMDAQTLKLTLQLEPGRRYFLQLNPTRFIDTDGLPMQENYWLEFESF
jgi:hypothetical protein